MEKLKLAFENRNKKQNKIEKIKQSKSPLSVIQNLENISKGGLEALDDSDAKYFLKCFGIYPKSDETFMIRVRVPAGRLSFEQAIMIANISKEYGRDYIDVTTRQQVELRYIDIKDLHTIITKLDSVGITTYQTGVDNQRNIVTDALDGISHDNIIETFPIVEKLQNVFLKKEEYISTLPRKFNTAILGSIANRCNIYGHDCCFVLAEKDGTFGFNVYLGGKVGVQAKSANLFVTDENIIIFYKALLDIFKEYGFRDNRNKNRLHFLIEAVGMEEFVEAIMTKAGCEFESSGRVLVDSQGLVSDKTLQKNSLFSYKITLPSGVTSGSDILSMSNISKEVGSGELRLSYDQNIYIIDINHHDKLLDSDIYKKYSSYKNIYFSDLIACAGRDTCAFGVIPNKPDATYLAEFLNNKVTLESGKVRMNWSGCVKGCGIHGIADIGFEGCKAKDKDGNTVDGVHIFLGGKITKEAKEAWTLLKSVPLYKAKHYVKHIIKGYANLKNGDESFEEFESRVLSSYSHQAIAFYAVVNHILEEHNLERFELKSETKTGKNENFEIFEFGVRLYYLLVKESRYPQVIDFEPVLDRKIKEDELTKLNKDVPLFLSEIIYKMTEFDKTKRYQVFSEILEELKSYV